MKSRRVRNCQDLHHVEIRYIQRALFLHSAFMRLAHSRLETFNPFLFSFRSTSTRLAQNRRKTLNHCFFFVHGSYSLLTLASLVHIQPLNSGHMSRVVWRLFSQLPQHTLLTLFSELKNFSRYIFFGRPHTLPSSICKSRDISVVFCLP